MKKYDYDVIVIGGGAAGLTAAGMAASFGAKTALIENKKLGGDCTWFGCVPSKALLKAAKVAHTISNSDDYGISASKPIIDIEKVLSKVHSIQNHIYNDADNPEIYEKMGVDVISGFAQFVNKNIILIKVNDNVVKQISSKYFFIAVGSSPVIPPIDGIHDLKFFTNENIFSIKKQPENLLVIGAGPIGLEMAQSFNRLGSKVTVVDLSESILNNDDRELSDILLNSLKKEGIDFKLGFKVEKFIQNHSSKKALLSSKEKNYDIEFDEVLIASGRKPNIFNLNLDNANVKYDKKGIIVNNSGRTNVSNIFAIGDCAGSFQFTHYAEHMAKKSVSTALLKIPFRFEPDKIIWATYTEPELAHVGLTQNQLKEKGINYKIYKFPFTKIDRAVTESRSTGLIKVYAKELNGKIYGADIVGENAGELINEFALAIKNKISLRKIADTIHAYPTYMLGNRRAADQWYVQKQSLTFVSLLKKIFGYQGQLPDLSEKERII